MSSLTIEVDDPEDAYENLRAMLEAAPVEFSQVTSVRLELEYESVTDATEQTATEEPDEPGAGFTDPTAVPPSGDDATAPPVDDATAPPVDDAETAEEAAVDGADEITFRKPDEDGGEDDQRSVFGDADETDGTDSVFSTPDDAVSFDDSGAAAGQQSDSKTTEDGRQLGSAVDRSTTEPGTADAGDGTAAASTPGGQQRTVNPSPQTYNKVVRLLQNRDFPIERSEIEDVAVGAYDVDDEECSAVIDAAIQKGLVAQEGSQLVDPTS
ncbi:hypothetical protein [Haloarchaeobius iranensis]|uniref:Uncharacterized protein n=1 Tax=Haloarchaeobius iranensis TaxID=996166 RepID=A0A1G9X659_9EURY|nr:hypothetical protein [Haloarchaeobius iranensis]SDM91825.1 hypothetical protein SAMN05192554_109159 [Haloarchaeobius iranensis]